MENVCRICLEQDKFLIDLKTCRYETQLSYYDLFVECTGIVLDETENSLICRSCKDLLSSAFNLKVRAKKSAEYLRSKTIEIVDVKCETVLIEIKQEVEDVKIKEEEPETVDQTITLPKKLKPRHKKPKKPKFVYHCRYCLRPTRSPVFQMKCERIHIKENNGLECLHCNYRSFSRQVLKVHIMNIHFFDPDRFKCPDCPLFYKAKSGLNHHRKRCHLKDDIQHKTFICQVCGKELRSRRYLKEHETRFHQSDPEKSRPIICDFCGKRFVQKSEVKMHIETVHLNLRPFKCEMCSKVFKRSLNLRLHMESEHEPNKKFICHVCAKEFKTSMSLYSHQTVHTGEYKFKCTFEGCTSVFKHKQALRSHQRTHGPVVFHQCEFCPKRFRHISSMRTHRYLHMPEKMHKCKLCEKSFKLPSLLKEHERRVHLGVRFECPTCGAGLRKKYNLKRHMAQHCTQGV